MFPNKFSKSILTRFLKRNLNNEFSADMISDRNLQNNISNDFLRDIHATISPTIFDATFARRRLK